MPESSERSVPAQHQRLLAAMAAGLTGVLQTDNEVAVDGLLERLAAAAEVHRAYVSEHVRGVDGLIRTRVLHEWAAEGLLSTRHLFDGHQAPAPANCPFLAALEQGSSVVARYSELPPDIQERFAPTSLRSCLTVPIEVDGRCWGQLGLMDCQVERAWTPDEEATLRTIASALGLAIEGRRAHHELERHLERIRDLHEAVATKATSVPEQIQRLLALATHHLDHELGFVLQVRESDVDTCEARYVQGPPGCPQPGDRLPLARGDYDASVSKRSTKAIPDFLESHARDHAIVTEHHLRSFIGVPVWVNDRPYGAVTFLSARPRALPFSPADRDFVGLVGRWVGASLEREQAESRRASLEERLREREKVDSLALAFAGLAHDFSNMLMVISTNLHIARRSIMQGNEAEVLESLDQAESAAARAAELKAQILTFAGRTRIECTPVDVARLVEEMTILLTSVMPPGVTIVPRRTAPLPPLLADATQLRQVLSNLILNAADAMRERGGTIWVGTGTQTFAMQPTARFVAENAPAGGYMWLEVEDGGVGISAEILGRIFDPFFTTKPGERGLGLAAVRGIVSAHRGCIDVESPPKGGTKIRVWLPITEG